ncbi:MAG: helix-turn-helix domain-containing protein [Desulfobacterales bacterium]|nr:helix-turn-helix domain-containing protein [Desulfobacterales bacterium]
MSTINKQIGLNIKSMRIKYGLSQIELAEKINLSFQQIQKYEKGATAISVSRLQQIAEAFGVPAQIFYPPPPQSDKVNEPGPVYHVRSPEPVTSPVFTPEERTLLKTFRKIRNRKVKQGVIQQLKGLVELERESSN